MDSKSRATLKRALEKSLDLLGEPSKRSLLNYLEKEFKIAFTDRNSPKVEEIESALRQVFGQGSVIITDQLRRNLERSHERVSARRPVAGRQARHAA